MTSVNRSVSKHLYCVTVTGTLSFCMLFYMLLYPVYIQPPGRYVNKHPSSTTLTPTPKANMSSTHSPQYPEPVTELNISTTLAERLVISLETLHNQLHDNIYWVYSNASDIESKIELYNRYLSHLLKEVIMKKSTTYLDTKTRKYVYGTSTDFLHKMSLSEDTVTVYLSFRKSYQIDFEDNTSFVSGNDPANRDFCVWLPSENSFNQTQWVKQKCKTFYQSASEALDEYVSILPVKQYYQCVVNKKLFSKITKNLQSDLMGKYGKLCDSKYYGLQKSTQFNPAYFIYNYSPLLETDVPHSDINDAFHFHRVKGSTQEQWNPSCANCYTAPQFLTYINIIKGNNITINDRGYVFKNDTRILVNSCHLSLTVNSFLNPVLSRNTTFYNAPILVLTQNYKDNYYHTLVEMATKVLFYTEFLKENPNVLIHFPISSSWSGIFFRMMGIRNDVISGNVTGQIVLLPMGNGCSDPPTPLLQQVNAFISKRFTSSINKPAVVYVHRSKDRSLKGADEILTKIKRLIKSHKLNYKLLIFNDTNLPSFKETVKMFQNAKLIIGPHGAGMSNILFARQGTFVVEVLCYAPYTRPCFRNMAYKLGLRYYATLTTKNNKGKRCVRGLYANMKELKRVLEYIFSFLSRHSL